MGKQVKPLLDKLLGSPNWLYDYNWDYYNGDVRLVKEVLGQMSRGYWNQKTKGIPCEEVLEIEMIVLKENIMFELDYFRQSGQISEIPKNLSLNDLVEFRRETIKKLSPSHWYRVDPLNKGYPCLAQAGRRIEAQQLSPEEALDAEMGALRNTVTLQINFYSNKDLDPENQVMDLDVLFRGLIEIIKQQPEEKQNSFNKLWAQNNYGETAKQIRDRYYKCSRGLP